MVMRADPCKWGLRQPGSRGPQEGDEREPGRPLQKSAPWEGLVCGPSREAEPPGNSRILPGACSRQWGPVPAQGVTFRGRGIVGDRQPSAFVPRIPSDFCLDFYKLLSFGVGDYIHVPGGPCTPISWRQTCPCTGPCLTSPLCLFIWLLISITFSKLINVALAGWPSWLQGHLTYRRLRI